MGGGGASECLSRAWVVGVCLFSSETILRSREELCKIFINRDKGPSDGLEFDRGE